MQDLLPEPKGVNALFMSLVGAIHRLSSNLGNYVRNRGSKCYLYLGLTPPD